MFNRQNKIKRKKEYVEILIICIYNKVVQVLITLLKTAPIIIIVCRKNTCFSFNF